MKKNSFLVAEVVELIKKEFDPESSSLIGLISINVDGINHTLKVKNLWADAFDYLWVGAKINLHHFKKTDTAFILDIQGYLILEPEILISPSQIRNAESCIRKHYVSKRKGATEKNYNMIRGSLINNAFDLLISETHKTKDEIIEKVLKDSIIQLVSLDEENLPEVEKIRADLETHIKSLMIWKTHKKFAESEIISTEPTFISNKYGMSGRLDLLANPGKEAITYELKTGKAPDSLPWKNDRYQVACYQLLLESAFECTNPDSYLIYSQGRGDDLLKNCKIDYETRREVINLRNKIVSIDYALTKDLSQAEIFNLIPQTEIGKCERCLAREDCFKVCAKFSEKSCSSCGVSKICKYKEEQENTSKELDYYNKYFKLIEIERNETRKGFSRIFSQAEALENEGKVILDLTYSDFENRVLKLFSKTIIESEIKIGDLVLLYQSDLTKGEVFKATVHYIDRYNIELKIKKDIDIDFFQQNTWCIYKDTMETTFDSMQGALFNFLKEKNTDHRNLILGKHKPRFLPLKTDLKLNPSLNEKQKLAIQKALSAEDYFLIQGPPGTGKTHTLANLIIEMVKMNKRVLLSGFTHRAIDNVLLKLVEYNFKDFIRIGSHEAVDPELYPYLLQEQIKHFDFEQLKDIQTFIASSPVVSCSSIYATSSNLINKLDFDYTIADEAGQLTETGTISAVLQGKKFILVGDHKQLPPVVQSEEAKNEGLAKSLFERLIDINLENLDDVLITLEEQYRMNEEIMNYSNINFYDFCLTAHEKIAKQTLNYKNNFLKSKYQAILNPQSPMIFVNHISKGNMKINPAEAKIIYNIVSEFVEYGIEAEKIGIITPFRAQVAEIKRTFFKNNDLATKITIDTVDRFQGSDRDLIIFSSVANDYDHITDFFTDFRRINVSVTRAKKKFILIGNKAILSKSELFYKLIRTCEYIGLDH